MWAITSEERTKHDKQFDNLKPSGGYITGDQARTFFLQSGLPAPVLAEIWALSDLNKDGKMDQQEFSIAMKLIKLKLQGQQLPVVLPPIMKQPPMFSPLISARFGMGSMPNLSIHQPLPPVAPITTPLSSATSGTSIPPLMMPAPLVPSVSTSSLPNGTASLIQPLSIPYSSSSECLISQSCKEETVTFVVQRFPSLWNCLIQLLSFLCFPSIASCIILQSDDGRIWWC